MCTILAFETSSNVGSVCVLRDDVVFEEHVRDDAKLSAWILPAIDRVLTRAAITLDEIDAIAFGEGPGSFTGVRTACATAQGLAYARAKPLYAIGTLEALAHATQYSNEPFNKGYNAISVILDARMNEAYCAEIYVRSNDELFSNSMTELKSLPDITLHLERNVYVGSGAILMAEREAKSSEDITAIRERTFGAESRWAEGVARLALAKIHRGDAPINPLDAEPRYVRNRVAQTEAERAAATAAASANVNASTTTIGKAIA